MLRNLVILLFSSLLLVTACSGENVSNENVNQDDTQSEILSESEIMQMYSDPAKFKGKNVELTGRVFVVEKDADGTYLQVFTDPKNSERNTLLAYNDPDFNVSENDYVYFTGSVYDEFKGQNAFGAEVTAPMITVDEIKVIDYITAVSPTLHEVEVNMEQDQHGYTINVQKIEFADDSTRVYISVANNTNDTINFWKHSAKVVQENNQFETEYNYEANYPEVHSDILPGVTSEGILNFPTLNYESNNLTLYLDGSSDNWDLQIDTFQFDITW